MARWWWRGGRVAALALGVGVVLLLVVVLVARDGGHGHGHGGDGGAQDRALIGVHGGTLAAAARPVGADLGVLPPQMALLAQRRAAGQRRLPATSRTVRTHTRPPGEAAGVQANPEAAAAWVAAHGGGPATATATAATPARAADDAAADGTDFVLADLATLIGASACFPTADPPGHDHACVFENLCYNEARGLFVVVPDGDGARTAQEDAAAAGDANVCAAGPRGMCPWSPTAVAVSALSRNETAHAALVFTLTPLVVGRPVLPAHAAHVLLSTVVPVYLVARQLDGLVARSGADAHRLWTATAGAATGPLRPLPPDVLLLQRVSAAGVDVGALLGATVRTVYQGSLPPALAGTAATTCYRRAWAGLRDACPHRQCGLHPTPNDMVSFREQALAAHGIAAPDASRRSPMRAAGLAGLHGGPRIVVVQRAAGRTRRIVNVDAVQAALAAGLAGATVVTAELESVALAEQMRLFADADVVVLVHGSAAGNALWMPEHAHVIELSPLGWDSAFFAFLPSVLSVHHHRVRCREAACALPAEVANERLLPRNRAVVVPLPDFAAAIDVVRQQLGGAVLPDYRN